MGDTHSECHKVWKSFYEFPFLTLMHSCFNSLAAGEVQGAGTDPLRQWLGVPNPRPYQQLQDAHRDDSWRRKPAFQEGRLQRQHSHPGESSLLLIP